MKPETALLIVDMVNRFNFEGGAALGTHAVRSAAAIARLRDRFDMAGKPVIYVNDNFMHWQSEFRDLVAECALLEGAPGAVLRKLRPKNGHYHMLKPRHSAFLATPLAILLAQLRVGRLVLTGIAADSCILATAQDAKMRDFALWVPSDAIAAQTTKRKRHALALIAQSLGAETRGSRAIGGLFPVTDP